VSLVHAQPFQSKKKGADGGVDGVKFFGDYRVAGRAGSPLPAADGAHGVTRPTGQEPRTSIHKIVVSVKGGGLKADDVRALNHVREREGAEIALFISLEEPTRGMVADAASAGFYQDGAGRKFPRVQLLTIEGLLSGQQRAEHPDHQPDLNFKKAKAEANAAQKDLI
jgi:site-specific DNA-methyltransferase (adenine-specific)